MYELGSGPNLVVRSLSNIGSWGRCDIGTLSWGFFDRRTLLEFLKLRELVKKTDVDALNIAREDFRFSCRSLEVSSSGSFNETSLLQIALCPMYPISEGRLSPTRKEFGAILFAQR